MCIDKQFSVSCDNNKVAVSMGHPKKAKFATYSIKKVLRSLFTKHAEATANKKGVTLTTSLESLDNIRNSQFEDHYEEIEDNAANEKLLSCLCDEIESSSGSFERISDIHCRQHLIQHQRYVDDNDQAEIFVPVRFARTDAGTFFWTTNLQPIATDDDLIQPFHCSTANQRPQLQFQDRWAQA